MNPSLINNDPLMIGAKKAPVKPSDPIEKKAAISVQDPLMLPNLTSSKKKVGGEEYGTTSPIESTSESVSVSTEPANPMSFLKNDIEVSERLAGDQFGYGFTTEPTLPLSPQGQAEEREKKKVSITTEPEQLRKYYRNRIDAIQNEISELEKKAPTSAVNMGQISMGVPSMGNEIDQSLNPNAVEIQSKKDYLEKLKSNVANVAAYAVAEKNNPQDGSDANIKKIGAEFKKVMLDPRIGDDLEVLKTMDASGAEKIDAERTTQNIDFNLYKTGADVLARYYNDVAEDQFSKVEPQAVRLNDLQNQQAAAKTQAEKDALQPAINEIMQDPEYAKALDAERKAKEYTTKSANAMDQFPQVKRRAVRQQLSDAYFDIMSRTPSTGTGWNSIPEKLANWLVGDKATEEDVPALAKAVGISEEEARQIVNQNIKGWFGSADEAGVRVPGMLMGVGQAADQTIASAVMGAKRFLNVENVEAKNRLLSDRIEDYNLKAQKAKLFDDFGNMNFNPTSVFNTMGTGIGQTAIYAAPSLVTGGAASVISGSEKIGKLMSVATTTGTGFVGSYEDGYKEAARYTDDEAKRRAYATKIGLVNGLSESILEPADIVKKMPGFGAKNNKDAFEAFSKMYDQKGAGAAMAQGLKEFGKVVGTENIEELAALVGETKFKESELGVVTPPGEFINQAIETAITTTLTTLPLGIGAGINAKRDQSGIIKEGLFEAGNEPELYKSRLKGLLDNGTLNQDQYNNRVSVVNTMAKIVPSIKPTDINGNPLSYSQKSDLSAQQFRILNNNKLLENPDMIEAEKPLIEADTKEALEIQTNILNGQSTEQMAEETPPAPAGDLQNDIRNDLSTKIESLETKNPMVNFMKNSPDEAINFIQEQATGMTATREDADEPTYNETVNMFGEDIVNQAVSILPQDQKDMIIKSWDAKGIVPPEGLLNAIRSSNINPNESQSSESGNQETGETGQESDSSSSQEEESITVNQVMDRPVSYKGKRATITTDGQTVIAKIEGENTEYELGNIDEIGETGLEEFEIEPEVSVSEISEDGSISVRGKSYTNPSEDPLSAIVRDEEGNVVSVKLQTPEGQRRTFRGQVAEDLAYQISLQEISKTNESRQQFEEFVEADEQSQQEIVSGENEIAATQPTEENNEAVQREPAKREPAERKKRTSKRKSATKVEDSPAQVALSEEAATAGVATNLDGAQTTSASEAVQVSDTQTPELAATAYRESAARLEEQGDAEGAQTLRERAETLEKEQASTPAEITTLEQAETELRRMFGGAFESLPNFERTSDSKIPYFLSSNTVHSINNTPIDLSKNARVYAETVNNQHLLKALDFIDPLLALPNDIKFDKEGSLSPDIHGLFMPRTNTVYVNPNSANTPKEYHETAAHELIHAVTLGPLYRDVLFGTRISHIVEDLRDHFKLPQSENSIRNGVNNGTIPRKFYGLMNDGELLSEIFTNEDFYNEVKKVKYKGSSILTSIFYNIVDAFERLTGITVNKKNTADAILNIVENRFKNSKRLIAAKDTNKIFGSIKGNPQEQERSIRDLIARSKSLNQDQLKQLIKKYTGWGDEKINSLFPKPTGIRHSQTKESAKEFGFDEYEKDTPETIAEWDRRAEEAIKSGYNVNDLISKIENGKHIPSKTEQRIMAAYISNLESQMETNPSDENLSNLIRAVKASDVGGGREVARSLVARRGLGVRDNSLAGFFVQQSEANEGAPITDAQKTQNEKEYKAIKEAQLKYEQKVMELEKENAKLRAEKAIKKESSQRKASKKSHADYVSERKEIFSSIREKLKKSRTGESGLTAVPLPFAKELIAIAPDVMKLTRSLLEEGVTKLSDIVKNIHNEIKDDIDGITEKDIHDIIAGDYAQPRPTKKQINEQLTNLRQQAKLENQLDDLLSGNKKPKTEKAAQQQSKEVEDLKQKISDFKQAEKDAIAAEKEAAATAEREAKAQQRADDKAERDAAKKIEKESNELTPTQKALKATKQRTQTAIKELEGDLKMGNYQEDKPPVLPLKLDREALDLKDKLIDLRRQRELRLLKHRYENRTRRQRAKDRALEILNVPRTIMASLDYSAPLRQAVIPTVANPSLAAKAGLEMFKMSFSQKRFDRWFNDVKEGPRYTIMKESGLYVADPNDPRLSAKEEAFMNNLAEKIPVLGRIIKASERAYVGYLNKMRVDVFNRMADAFENEGITYMNNPKLYESLASWVNNSTGRGGMGKIESAAPILNSVFFSPRLIASRFNILGLSDATTFGNGFYGNMDSRIRKEAAKDIAKFVGAGVTLLSLIALSGGDDEDDATVEVDPRSTDFGKIKKGNTRWDIWGGFQQYARLVAQLVTGEKKSASSGAISDLSGDGRFGESRGDVLARFVRGKLAPVPAVAWNLATGRNVVGEKVDIQSEALQHLSPLIISDMKEAIRDKGVSALFTMGIPSVFGVGVQTFNPRGYDDVDIKSGVYKTLFDKNLNLKVPEQGEMPKKTYEKFLPVQQQIFKQQWNEVINNGAMLNEDGGTTIDPNKGVALKPFNELTHEELGKLMQSISGRATREAEKEVGYEKPKEKKNQEYIK